jgi:hypothetical protein
MLNIPPDVTRSKWRCVRLVQTKMYFQTATVCRDQAYSGSRTRTQARTHYGSVFINAAPVSKIQAFTLHFKRSPWNEYCFLVLDILHGMRGKFTDDVSGAAVGPIFTGHESERKWAMEWDAALYRGGVDVAHLHFESWPWRWDPQRLPKRRR